MSSSIGRRAMIGVSLARILLIVIVLMISGGCTRTQSSNYYILHSIPNPGPDVRTAAADHDPAIGIGPVKIPEYLDRPQIVARSSDSGLQYSEFDKWAESLEKNLTRVLAVNLSALVPSERVFIYPWLKSMQVQYQVTLDILQLEKVPDGSIVLDARWSILGNDGEKLLFMKRSKIVMPAESAGFGGIASAESKAVEALSREMAVAIQSLPWKAL